MSLVFWSTSDEALGRWWRPYRVFAGDAGAKPQLFGTTGRDFNEYRQWLESHGVDCSTVKHCGTKYSLRSYFANTDLDNNTISAFYACAMNHADKFLWPSLRWTTDWW